MKTIWKFPLKLVDEQTIDMPFGFYPLTVQMQGGVPCLWVLVEPLNSPEPFKIFTYGTGHQMPDSITRLYLGTYQLENGALVFHVFQD